MSKYDDALKKLSNAGNKTTVFDQDTINGISKTLEDAGYSLKEIKKLFDNESPEQIMSKYDDALKKLSNSGNKTTVFDQNIKNGISKTLEEAGYSLKEINEIFSNESPEQIMSKYDDALKKLSNTGNKTTVFDQNTKNGISKTLEDAGYSKEYIQNLFNNSKESDILNIYNDALIRIQKDNISNSIENSSNPLQIFMNQNNGNMKYRDIYINNRNFNLDYINYSNERSFLYNNSKNVGGKYSVALWGGNGNAFMNFIYGTESKDILGIQNTYKIYLPVDSKDSFKNMDNILKFMAENNISNNSKIQSRSATDGICLRVNTVEDAAKVIDYINNNNDIKVYSNPSPFARKYGKVAIAMDGNSSYNSATISAYSNYIKTTSNPSIDGFVNYLKKIKSEIDNGNYKKISIFDNAVNLENVLYESSQYVNAYQILETIIVGLDKNASMIDYLNVLQKHMDYDTNLKQTRQFELLSGRY